MTESSTPKGPGDPAEAHPGAANEAHDDTKQAVDEAKRAAAEAATKAAAAAKEVGKDLKDNASEAAAELRGAAREASDRARAATADMLGKAKEELEREAPPPESPRSPLADDPSSTGFDANLAAALSYVCAPITGPLFFVLERKNRFVRFHALQSILFVAASIVIWVVLSVLSVIGLGGFFFALASFGLTIVWLLLMWKALKWEEFRLPFIGDIARSQVDRRDDHT